MLSVEKDEPMMEFKAMLEDPCRLIELYEEVNTENNNRNITKGVNAQDIGSKVDSTSPLD